jgi:hypothetical protein
MKKLLTGLLSGLFLFIATRALASLLGLDELARRLAESIRLIPGPLQTDFSWLLAGTVGLASVILWLLFNVDELLRGLLKPGPAVGSFVIVGDPTFKINANSEPLSPSAELFINLLNRNESLLEYEYELIATVNGKSLERPILGTGLASAQQKIRLFVRLDDVPQEDALIARFEYRVRYWFHGLRRKHRFTARGIEWKTMKPKGQPKAGGGKVVLPITVTYYFETEE